MHYPTMRLGLSLAIGHSLRGMIIAMFVLFALVSLPNFAHSADALQGEVPVPNIDNGVQKCDSSNPESRYFQIPGTQICLDIYGQVEATAGYIRLEDELSGAEEKSIVALYRGMIGADTFTSRGDLYVATSARVAATGNTDQVTIEFERALLSLGADAIKGEVSAGYDESQWSKFTNAGILGYQDRNPRAIVTGYHGFHRSWQAAYLGSFGTGDVKFDALLGAEMGRDDLTGEININPMGGISVEFREMASVSAMVIQDNYLDNVALKVSGILSLPQVENLIVGGWYSMQFGDNETLTSQYVDGTDAFGIWAQYYFQPQLSGYIGYTDAENNFGTAVIGGQWQPTDLNITLQPELAVVVDDDVSGYAGFLRAFVNW